jgi:hypothetical protein
MKPRHAAIALALGIGLVACDGTTTTSTCTATCSETGSNVQSLQTWASAGRDLSLPGDSNWIPSAFGTILHDRWDSVVNLSKYRVAADSDLSRILADWASRTPRATGWTQVASSDTAMGTGHHGTLSLVRFSVDGVSQGALVWTPTASGKLPVLLVGHPGDGGVSDDILSGLGMLMGVPTGALVDSVILVAPAYRGETAWLGNDSVVGDPATASPWDRDVDDALGLLQAELDREPRADAARISAFGFSRGAGVSLLAALRDARIRSVFEIAGPTDFFAPSIQQVAFALYAGQSIDLPGVNYLTDRYVAPLWNGSIPADSIRTALLRRSPARLAGSHVLPDPVVAVQGLSDSTVFPEHTRHLAAADPRVDTTMIAGMGHTTWLESANLFTQALPIGNALTAFLRNNLKI